MPRGDVRLEIVPPTRGVRTDLPRHLVPDGYLTDGYNVLCRDGRILIRPGMSAITAVAPSSDRIMGGVYYEDHTQTARTIVGTKTKLYSYAGGVWSDVTGSALTGGDDNQVRFSVYPFANRTSLIAVNDVDAPRVWTGSGNFSSLGGSPPIAKSTTVAFQRVILANVTTGGSRRGSELWISGFQNEADWTTGGGKVVNLTDTKDNIIEVQALNAQVFAIYKDRSQWVGIGAGGLFPFVFELRDQQVGPCAPGAVVQAETAHYYIGQDGDIYRFDGNRCQAIGGAVKRLIQQNLNFNQQTRVNGFYDRLNREIWWFFPSTTGTANSYGVVYRVPYDDVPGAFSPLMQYALEISASFSWTEPVTTTWNTLTGTWDTLGASYPTWNSFPVVGRIGSVAASAGGQAYAFGGAGGDGGVAFDAQWDMPFRAASGVGYMVRVDVVESMFKQTAAPVTAQIILLTSDNMKDNGTAATAQMVDLSVDEKHRATYYDLTSRFVALRHRVISTNGLQEYLGGVAYLYKRGES